MLLSNFVDLFLESAPWLLLGLVMAGMLKMFVPMAWMHKQLGGSGVKATVKAAVLGAPLPLCSCGVIPAAVGLRRSGASKAATTSFLVSTPETGVDSVTVSYVLLGPFLAIVRPITAVTSAVVAGLLVGRDEEQSDKASITKQPTSTAATPSCCSRQADASKNEAPSRCCSSSSTASPTIQAAEKESSTSSCCASKQKPAVVTTNGCCSSEKPAVVANSTSCCSSTKDVAAEIKNDSVISKIGKGLVYAATDLVGDTTFWLLIGLFFAALVQTYVPGDFLAQWGTGIIAMLVMVVVSIPMYICATASTPIAAGLLLAGVSPGAVLVFMMAGPASNIATIGVVAKELGKRAVFGYLGGVLGVALIAGTLVDYLVVSYGIEVMPQVGGHHQLLPEAVVVVSGIVLAILMARAAFNKLPKYWWRRNYSH